ncbi:MAG: ABC transporter ATP-binding protein [Galactobacter sp.]
MNARTTTRPGVELKATGLQAGYGAAPILDGVDLEVIPGSFTVIIGPNACGKSTLLRSLARVLTVDAGTVWLDGEDISAMASKTVARKLGLLPQTPTAPPELRVHDLVARGRYPHRGVFGRATPRDSEAIAAAMAAARVTDLADRPVSDLSGGQRQRVWIAMVLAQETDLLLLDEPTTYLDIAHQLEVLNLAEDLHRKGSTVVAVLHDLNLAFRYATNLVVMRDGAVLAEGAPSEIVSSELISRAFDVQARILADPETGSPLVVPLRRAR